MLNKLALIVFFCLCWVALAAGAQAAQVYIYWDKPDPYGDYVGKLEAGGGIEVPAEACGFRLGLHGHDWDGGWHFGTYGNMGNPLVRHGVLYSSANPNISKAGPIEVTGPVGACAGSNYAYNFITPLAGPFGVVGDSALHGSPAAGSFVADVFDGSELTWLDYAGQAIPAPKPGKPDPKPPKLPPEFLGKTPSLVNCIRDFSNEYHCGDGAAAAPMPAGVRGIRARTAPGRAESTVANPGIISAAMTVAPPTSRSGMPADGVACPASLVLSGTIHRDPGFQADPDIHADYEFNPPVVEYRFYFVPEHVASTRFTVALNQAETKVSHTVPIPLPPPIGGQVSGGVTPGSTQLAVATRPDDTTPPGSRTRPGLQDASIVADTGPEHVHQGTVRLQLTNIVGANGHNVQVSSPPTTYRIECRQDEVKPDRPVLTTPLPVPPPQPPGSMAAPQTAPTVTCQGGTVRGAGCICPRGQQAVVAGENAWRCIPVRRTGG